MSMDSPQHPQNPTENPSEPQSVSHRAPYDPSSVYPPQQPLPQQTPSLTHPQYAPLPQSPYPSVPPVHHKQKQPVTFPQQGVISQKVQQLFMYLYSAVSILLAARFILSLIAADAGTPFVSMVYQFSQPLVVPFMNMFGHSFQAGAYRFEFETLVALLVYALLFIGIAKLIGIIFD